MAGSARVSKADGEKSRSHSAQAVQRSVMVIETVLPPSRMCKLIRVFIVYVADHRLTVSGHLPAADRVGVGVYAVVAPVD